MTWCLSCRHPVGSVRRYGGDWIHTYNSSPPDYCGRVVRIRNPRWRLRRRYPTRRASPSALWALNAMTGWE